MEYVKALYKHIGVDVGFHGSNLEPLNGKGRIGKAGIDKNYTLEQMVKLAYEIKANVIVKSGPRAKWYLKRFPVCDINREIEKQAWRDTSKTIMYVISWDN